MRASRRFPTKVACADAGLCGLMDPWVGAMTITTSLRGPRAEAHWPEEHARLKTHMSRVRKHPTSGKQGQTVSYKTPYGQAERELTVPANPRTAAQGRRRSAVTQFATRWRILTDEQRGAWVTFARTQRSEPRLGQPGPLTGCQAYIGFNCVLTACGQPSTDIPPDRVTFANNPVGDLTITNDDGDISLKLGVARAPTQLVMVLATAPCSAGMSVPRRFVILCPLPAPVGRVSEVTGLYTARFGVPPVGSRIFIRTQQMVNGWQDFPKDTTAVVPAK